jgi:hypothetical protein
MASHENPRANVSEKFIGLNKPSIVNFLGPE